MSATVRVRCERCKGSGKDPQMGTGGVTYDREGVQAWSTEPWPCQAMYGGCGGTGCVEREPVGADAAPKEEG